MSKKTWAIGVVSVLLFALGLFWLVRESSKPLPGEQQKDEGREHVAIGTKVTYKTNPPTSGKHYPDWRRPGIYSEPQQDEYIVHSLEHGYIVINYTCEKAKDLKACEAQIKKTAAEIVQDNGRRKLIVAPRAGMDSPVIVTAWTRMLKLSTMDKKQIGTFIDAFRDHGPENTME